MPLDPMTISLLSSALNDLRQNEEDKYTVDPALGDSSGERRLARRRARNSRRDLNSRLNPQLRRQAFRDRVSEIPDIASGIGSLLEQVSIRDDGSSNPRVAALAGGLRGGAAGASLGPLGIIGGALLGGASSFGAANQSNADFFDNKALNEAFNLSAKTVSPSIFGKGGLIDGDQFVPVQMELDETYVTEDLNIYDSKATDKHEKMDDEEISDVVKNNSFAFSNRKELRMSDHADDVLGYGVAHYSEDGRFNLDKVTMKDIFGDSKKKIKFSEAAKLIRKHYKVVREDDKNADLLTKITNQENKQARAPFVNQLVKIHEDLDDDNIEPIVPQKFGKGGKMRKKKKVKKYMPGGFIDDPIGGYSYIDDNGNVISVDENGNETIVQRGDSLNTQLGSLGLELDRLEQANEQNFATTNRDTRSLFNRLNTRNGLASILQGAAVGLQSTQVNPRLQDARFVDQMFDTLSPAVGDQLVSEGFSRANSLVANVARSNPRAALQLGPQLFDSALRGANSTRLNLIQDRLNQDRGKARFLNRLGNVNRAERIRADEATRNLVNRKRRDLANVGVNFLQNRDRLDVNKFQLDRQAIRERNDNNLSLFQNRLNVNSMRDRTNAQLDFNRSFLKQLEQSLSRRNSPAIENGTPNPDVPLNEDLLNQLELEPIFDLPDLSRDELLFYGSLI